ncbi:MAG TPA: alpha/beta fold hydrolase [Gemmatimonadaceae bacterium]
MPLRPRLTRSRLAAVTSIAAIFVAALPVVSQTTSPAAAESFTLDQVLSLPFPTDLTTSATGQRAAWVVFARGVRNVYAAEGPQWAPRKLTSYTQDDGQEITNLSISADGKWVVYTLGGDHGSNWQGENGLQPNPNSLPVQREITIWAVPFDGGASRKLADGDDPVISPASDRVAYERQGQIWMVPLDASAPGKRFFFEKGVNTSPVWSPDGARLAFVSRRVDHSFVGVFASDSTPIVWLAPSTDRDFMPRWSPDGSRIAFVRLHGEGGPPEPLLKLEPEPWQIWTADARTGEGRVAWTSPVTLRGSYPTTEGQANLHWMGRRLAFLSDVDGWPHLYSVADTGGEALRLTTGSYMTEYITPSADGRWLYYSANTGATANDGDRRHIFRVPVDAARPERLAEVSNGLEWTPKPTGDGASVVFISATAQRPPLIAVATSAGSDARLMNESMVPADFPSSQLVTPKYVSWNASDGTRVYGQLFERPGGARKPAVVFVHGGPPRQMLLGWHYSWYYTNAYAVNQYLANRGYAVLSINYRLGIGYGHDFHHPPHAGPWGASEYLDVKSGGEFLRARPEVDARHIGIWGGSYGGFLTAMALAKNSDIFAAGVDLHGVHDWTSDGGRRLGQAEWRFEKGDRDSAAAVAWRSSPVAWLSHWKSPVLLIQGDDDRNVRFHQTVDLMERLRKTGVHVETLVFPDEIHDFLRWTTWYHADVANVKFFDRMFGVAAGVASERR